MKQYQKWVLVTLSVLALVGAMIHVMADKNIPDPAKCIKDGGKVVAAPGETWICEYPSKSKPNEPAVR